MPYEPNHDFQLPKDENAQIWRYMDFAKFVSLLNNGLFFVRADRLGDPFEGSLPDIDRAFREAKPEDATIVSAIRRSFFLNRSATLVNCWHINNHESAAMWSQYSKNAEGIAVQSTVRRLIDSLDDAPHRILIGKVRYIDYTTESASPNDRIDLLTPLLIKRVSFEPEQELRALVWVPGNTHDVGAYLPTNLHTLIDRVFISPTSPLWVKAVVNSVLQKYGVPKPVIRSNLGDDPIW